MNSNELRIANKLQKGTGEIFTVLRIDNTNDILVEEQRGLLTLNYNLFGILLTEEWLLKSGFEMRGYITFLRHTYQRFVLGRNSMYTLDDNAYIYEINDHQLCEIKYLHQLQNLYFALTGEELTIKS